MKFTFARANAAKLVRLPWYAMMGLVALCVPRRRHLWVFGRKTGVGEGPLRLWHEVRRCYPAVRLVWLAQDRRQRDEAIALGLEAYTIDSWKARWLTLRAGVGVVTHGFGDLARPFVPGMRVIQLWHGSPLKRIHLDAANVHGAGRGALARFGSGWMRWAFALSARLIAFVPCSSPMVAERFRTAWGYRDLRRIEVTGDPRCDVLLEGAPAERRAASRKLLKRLWGEQDLPRRLVLFAPTWRDGDADPTLPCAGALERLEAMLGELDAWLVVRSHPWGVSGDGRGADASGRIRFLDASMLNDVNLALNAFDVLMTDYSAIAMDYCLLARPIVFFAPDLASYERSRGLYEPYAQFTGGEWFGDWDAVVGKLRALLADELTYAREARRTAGALRARYHHYVDAGSALRVLDRIAHRLGWRAPRGQGEVRRILHVSGCLGGVETYLRLLAEYHDERRLGLGFVLPEPCALGDYARSRGMPLRLLPMRRDVAPVADARALLALRRIVREQRPDVVHLHSSKAGLLGRLACLGLDCRVVYTPHAYFYLSKRGIARWPYLIAEQLLDRIARSRILGTSPSEARRAVREVRCAPSRVDYILNAVDAAALRAHCSGGGRRHDVMLVARVSEQKNLPMYLETVRLLRGSGATCLLVGVGHYSGDRLRLERMMKRAGIGADELTVIEWMPRDALLGCMARVGVVVLTSTYESFGYVLAEANCLGVPVVGTRVDGVRDVIEDGVNGYLVAPDDAASMARRIRELLACPAHWRTMSMRAREAATGRLDMARAMPEFEAYYAAVAGDGA
jgi:glycosyltransferase involved in cell wall biosynthesis/CDP-glycerol glycerophosphotransferase (TagB/SpsB family)